VIQDCGERQAAMDKATGKPEKILAVNYYYKSSKPQYNDTVKKNASRLSHDQNSKSFVGRNITSPAFTLTRSNFQLG
jgi:hypothetical protein